MPSSTCSCVLKPRVPNPLEKSGIVSILGSDCDESGGAAAAAAADMSSKNWLREEEEEEGEDELMKRGRPGQDEVWKAIQAQNQLLQQGDGDHNKPPIRSTVSWSAILLSDQKVDLQDSPPYIHPLLKKSSSCSLSKQSLQICTESLGSETGSDCLSSQTPCDSDHIQNEVHKEEEEEDIFNHVKINYSKKSPSLPPSSFPPPLPSLANSSVQLRSHRQGKGEGKGSRLILKAVSIPQRNYFHAERSHGRLLLTALKSPGSSHEQEEEAGGDDETEEFKIHNSSSDDGSNEDEEELSQLAESSMVAVEGAGHATTPSFNSNTNHLYWNSGSSSSIAEYKQQQEEEEEEGLIPLLRNCKEARRRSLLTWVPPNYCIATSS